MSNSIDVISEGLKPVIPDGWEFIVERNDYGNRLILGLKAPNGQKEGHTLYDGRNMSNDTVIGEFTAFFHSVFCVGEGLMGLINESKNV